MTFNANTFERSNNVSVSHIGYGSPRTVLHSVKIIDEKDIFEIAKELKSYEGISSQDFFTLLNSFRESTLNEYGLIHFNISMKCNADVKEREIHSKITKEIENATRVYRNRDQSNVKDISTMSQYKRDKKFGRIAYMTSSGRDNEGWINTNVFVMYDKKATSSVKAKRNNLAHDPKFIERYYAHTLVKLLRTTLKEFTKDTILKIASHTRFDFIHGVKEAFKRRLKETANVEKMKKGNMLYVALNVNSESLRSLTASVYDHEGHETYGNKQREKILNKDGQVQCHGEEIQAILKAVEELNSSSAMVRDIQMSIYGTTIYSYTNEEAIKETPPKNPPKVREVIKDIVKEENTEVVATPVVNETQNEESNETPPKKRTRRSRKSNVVNENDNVVTTEEKKNEETTVVDDKEEKVINKRTRSRKNTNADAKNENSDLSV